MNVLLSRLSGSMKKKKKEKQTDESQQALVADVEGQNESAVKLQPDVEAEPKASDSNTAAAGSAPDADKKDLTAEAKEEPSQVLEKGTPKFTIPETAVQSSDAAAVSSEVNNTPTVQIAPEVEQQVTDLQAEERPNKGEMTNTPEAPMASASKKAKKKKPKLKPSSRGQKNVAINGGATEQDPPEQTMPAVIEASASAMDAGKAEAEADRASIKSAASPKKQSSDEKLFGLIVHGTDRLKTKLYLKHPVIKVYLVDSATGLLLRKSISTRPAAYWREAEKLDCILPLMTMPCNLQDQGENHPKWNELLLFNENYDYCFGASTNALFLFELLDFYSMHSANVEQSNGWHRIAWAFLKLVGANGMRNAGKWIRLQLYRSPRFYRRQQQKSIDVFEWWKSLPRLRYPSTLYISTKPIQPPERIEPSIRSMSALQQESGISTPYLDALLRGTQPKDETNTENAQDTLPAEVNIWSRIAGQPCKVPNKKLLTLNAGKLGCIRLQFSPSGRDLACAGKESAVKYPIFLYDIPSGIPRGCMNGHAGPVYDMAWTSDSLKLLTASGDSTVRLWHTHELTCICVLAHSAFVYCCALHPLSEALVFTGSFDKIIRIWDCSVKADASPKVVKELTGHKGYVNVVRLTADGTKLFAGDSKGTITIWSAAFDASARSGGRNRPDDESMLTSWRLTREFTAEGMEGICVNSLQFHPDNKRMLLLFRKNELQCIDCRVFVHIRSFFGSTIDNLPVRCCLSPCGTFLFCGSEDGKVIVWLANNGGVATEYESQGNAAVLDVQYHPHEHMLAFATLGEFQYVTVMIYDSQVPDLYTESTAKTIDVAAAPSSEAVKRADEQDDYLNYSVAKLLQEHKILLKETQATIASRPARLDSARSVTSNKSFEVGRDDGVFERRSQLLRQPSLLASMSVSQLTSAMPGQEDGKLKEQIAAGGSISMPLAPVVPTPDSGREIAYVKVKAQFSYKPQSKDEIGLSKGDVISVMSQDNADWWVGFVQPGVVGYFPANYVKLL